MWKQYRSGIKALPITVIVEAQLPSDFSFILSQNLHRVGASPSGECTGSYGGAIYAEFVMMNLQIGQCSFHTCSGVEGGAVCIRHSSSSSFSFSSSSFVGCSARGYGGSLFFEVLFLLSISDCVFLDSTTSGCGGAMYLFYCRFSASAGLSNTLFQNCTQTGSSASWEYGGGGITLNDCNSDKVCFLQFRQCSSLNKRGHDIYLLNTSFTSNSFSTCDSTSNNTHRVTGGEYPTFTDHSDLLADAKNTASVISLASTLPADDTVTLTLTLDKEVSGTMIVIVSNLEGRREEVDGKAPRIGRLLLFTFSSSTVGTCSSSVGESGVLQFPLSDFKLLAASLSNHDVTIPSDFTLPDVPPTLLHVSCELDVSGTEVEVSFSGFGLPKVPCTLTLNDSITLEVTFEDDSFGRSVGSVKMGVSGKDGELSEKTEYSLTGIVSNVDPDASIRIASGVGFIVPTAGRLTKVSVSGFVDERKTKVKLSFESVKLEKNKKYILKMKRTDTSEDTITREVWTDENRDVLDVSEILYPFEASTEGRKEQLEFGVSYGVLSLTASDCTRSVLISDIVITMPDEPPRIIRCLSRVLSEDQQTLRIHLEGRAIDASIGRLCLTRNWEVWESIRAVTVSSSTICFAEFRVGEEEWEEGVGIGKEYTLIEMEDGSSGCVVENGIRIKVPGQTIMCRRGGNNDVEKCGDSSRPCSSLLVGWKAGLMVERSTEENVELEVDGEVEMGGVLLVGEKKVGVWGGEKGRGRVLVEWRESWKSTNAIEVEGGQVAIVEVMIVLGEEREEGMEKRKGFVICGGGEVCVERVVVERVGVGRVGMGLVGLWWGSADLVSIEMEEIEFADGVVFVEVGSEKKDVSLSVSSLKTRGIRTLNAPLISFCCESEESRVTMEKMIVLETTREESVGGVGVEEGGVVSVRTKQRETRFVGCVFSGSKTRLVGDGEEVGGVLFVGVGGKAGGSVRFEDCLVMDSVAFGREGGGVVVVVSSGVFVVWFSRCWMEETRVSGIGFDCLDGVPQVSSDRAVVSGVGVVGALIVGEESLPIVGRSSSRFSGCSLKVVVGREGGKGGQKNEETKTEL
ncbi:hypothetical protein BLNAU_17148 [Blattamonas nauphoetae]|uniref:Uncharacterized protein n=1 Tax=Blattamonas nauphoetae TaxID=2049346 RepID=A0ABQ9XCB2_9EUKA|nr:hypothetical protein BLNAU_17148 [Blattamonas nauphoetae]